MLRDCGRTAWPIERHMSGAICVYSSSSDAVAPVYFAVARELGAAIARANYALVFGGAKVGLMGALARSVHENGGTVIGVIPAAIHERGLAYDLADELIVARDLRERKAVMDERANAFIALPGGFGTLEEMLEILTLKQLQVHAKPIVFINTSGFYDRLVDLFEHMYREQFAKSDYRQLYHIAADVESAFIHIGYYQPVQLQRKWF